MKATEIKKSTIKRRLKAMFKKAPQNILNDSMEWYSNANKFSQEMSLKYGISTTKIAAIISALSPAIGWIENKQNAIDMLNVYTNFGELENCQYSTYGQNALKAWNILIDSEATTELEIFNKYFNNDKSGFKTANFFLNISNPNNKEAVTIDRHQLSICKNLKKSGGGQTAGKRAYEILKEVHIETAKELNILPQQLQAVTWSTFRTEVLGYQFH
tara:strand:+ start:406 stop:1050 length:645 start_codon:yes stop_codon:yes gene_type:complete